MQTLEREMVTDIFNDMLNIAKREQMQSAKTALLRAQLRIIHEDIFPAHMPHLGAI